MLQKIISGGQTGVDRAALDAAMGVEFPCGGWCPKGRRAEDGIILPLYPLEETSGWDYVQRTKWNVNDSDATLILTEGEPTEGTALTIDLTRKQNKPCLVVDFFKVVQPQEVVNWIKENQIRILNVAGPRASKKPEIYEKAKAFVQQILIPFS